MSTPPPEAMQASEITDTGGVVIGWTWLGEHESVFGGVLKVWFAQYVQAQEAQVIGFDGATRDDAEWFVRLSHNIAGRADAEAKIVRDWTRRHLREAEVMVYVPCDGGFDEGEDPVEAALSFLP